MLWTYDNDLREIARAISGPGPLTFQDDFLTAIGDLQLERDPARSLVLGTTLQTRRETYQRNPFSFAPRTRREARWTWAGP